MREGPERVDMQLASWQCGCLPRPHPAATGAPTHRHQADINCSHACLIILPAAGEPRLRYYELAAGSGAEVKEGSRVVVRQGKGGVACCLLRLSQGMRAVLLVAAS